MIAAFDTYYFDNKARTVCLLFENWKETRFYKTFCQIDENVAAYESGNFYKRELPGILHLMNDIHQYPIEAVIVDGFVFLDDNNKPGLGGHLYEMMKRKIPVIGVAKSDYSLIKQNKTAILRGQSKNPLYITAAGMELAKAAELIKELPGDFRIPDMLKQLDRMSKDDNFPCIQVVKK